VAAGQLDCALQIEAAMQRGSNLAGLVQVPAGTVGMPLQWHPASANRMLSLGLLPVVRPAGELSAWQRPVNTLLQW
jgi:hypothetical protein